MPTSAARGRMYPRKQSNPKRSAPRTYRPKAKLTKTVRVQVNRALTRNIERKWISTVVNNANAAANNIVDSARTVCLVSNVPLGTGGFARVGERIKPTLLQLKIMFYQGLPSGVTARVVVFKVKNTGFIPSGTSLATGSGTANVYTLTAGNVDALISNDPGQFDGMSKGEGFQGQVQVIRDKWINQGTMPIGTPKSANMTIPLTGTMHFNPSQAGSDHPYYVSVSFFSEWAQAGALLQSNGTTATGTVLSGTGPVGWQGIARMTYQDA